MPTTKFERLPGGSGYTPGIIHTYPGKDWMQMYKNWMYDNCTNQEIKDLGRESFDVFQDLCQSFLPVSYTHLVCRVSGKCLPH